MSQGGRYTKLLKRFWRDPGIRSLNDEQKLAVIYMMNCQANRIGLFAFSVGMAAEDLGWDIKRTARIVDQVQRALGWSYDDRSRVLYIPSWWRTNAPENLSHFKGCLADLEEVPPTALVLAFLENTAHLTSEQSQVLTALADTCATRVPTRVPPGVPHVSPQVGGDVPPSVAVAVAVTRAVTETVAVEGAAAPPKPQTASRRQHRKPDDIHLTAEAHAFATETGIEPGAVDAEWARFSDHEFKRAISDWPAAWRNWCRRAVEYRQGVPVVGRATTAAGRTMQAVREAFNGRDDAGGISDHRQPPKMRPEPSRAVSGGDLDNDRNAKTAEGGRGG